MRVNGINNIVKNYNLSRIVSVLSCMRFVENRGDQLVLKCELTIDVLMPDFIMSVGRKRGHATTQTLAYQPELPELAVVIMVLGR